MSTPSYPCLPGARAAGRKVLLIPSACFRSNTPQLLTGSGHTQHISVVGLLDSIVDDQASHGDSDSCSVAERGRFCLGLGKEASPRYGAPPPPLPLQINIGASVMIFGCVISD